MVMNLRSGTSGAPFEGEADGDTLIWDEAGNGWRIGQGARRSCMLTLGEGNSGANFFSGQTLVLGFMQESPKIPSTLVLTGDAAFTKNAANVFAVQYHGPTITVMADVAASCSNGDATKASLAGLGISLNDDLVATQLGDQRSLLLGAQRVDVPAGLGSLSVFSMNARRRMTISDGDIIGVCGCQQTNASTLDVLFMTLTVQQV